MCCLPGLQVLASTKLTTDKTTQAKEKNCFIIQCVIVTKKADISYNNEYVLYVLYMYLYGMRSIVSHQFKIIIKWSTFHCKMHFL